MKISRNSWHYKVYQFEGPRRDPEDLCTYTKGIISRALLWFFLTLVTVVWVLALPLTAFLCVMHGCKLGSWHPSKESFCVSYTPISAFGQYWYPSHFLAPLASFWALAQTFASLEWFVFPLGSFLVLFLASLLLGLLTWISYVAASENLKDYLRDNRISLEDKPQTLGTFDLLGEYLKAKKSKVCPLVTFED